MTSPQSAKAGYSHRMTDNDDWVAVIPLDGDEFTPDALASMTGTVVTLSVWFDRMDRLGKATIRTAAQRDGNLVLTLDPTESAAERVANHFGGWPKGHSIGYIIKDATAVAGGHRIFEDVRVMEVALREEPLDVAVPRG